MAFRCLAQDVMTEICLGISTKTLQVPDFQSPLILAMDANLRLYNPLRSFPTLRKLLYALPPDLVFPGEASVTQYESMIAQQVTQSIEDSALLEKIPPETLLRVLLNPSENSSLKGLDTRAVIAELQTFIVGGGETVANTLVLGFNSILQRPQLYASLQAEISAAWPRLTDSAPGVEVLERLPLLTATIKESLRLTHGVASPLPRIVPPSGARIDGYPVPGGTSVGVSHVLVHMSQETFADPDEFEPTRWMRSPKDGSSDLDNYLVAFSKGPRSCMGINVAWCELYLTFATLIRLFRMDRPEAVNDPEMQWRDCFHPLYTGRQVRVQCNRTSH